MGLWSWLKRGRLDESDFEEEIRSHLAMAADEHRADGANDHVARLAARKAFGNVTLTTEAARRVWSSRWVEALRDLESDLRHAVRVLRKSPGFSLVVIAVLALGIGLNATVFSLFKGLALRPLAGVEGSAALRVVVAETSAGRRLSLSYQDYRYLRDHDRAFSGLSGSSVSGINLGLGTRGERVMAEFVTGNYFQVLGVGASLGRTLLPTDEQSPGSHPVVVLSDGLWRRAFDSDPNIVGRAVHFNGYPLTVVGVAAPAFHGSIVSFDVEAFVPIMMAPQFESSFPDQPRDVLHDRKASLLMVLGRPLPGHSLASAAAQTAALSSQLEADAPVADFSRQLKVLPIWRSPYGAQTYMLPAIVVVGVMGGLLLLIVGANIAGLVLVRGMARSGEIAVRLALGAGRGRILRLLIIENVVLAVPAVALGLLIAERALPLMWGAAASAAPARLFLNLSVDGIVVGFAVLISCASVLVFGLMPALRSSRPDLVRVLTDAATPRAAVRSRLRAVLVVAQVAVSLLLLVAAGLVARSLDAARHANAGFDPQDTVSLTLDVLPSGYDASRGRVFYQQLLDRVRDDAGVLAASLAAIYPMTLIDFPGVPVTVEGYQSRRDEDLIFSSNVVADGYFKTLRIPLVAGREFDARDDELSQAVIIVNETFARRFWGEPRTALGKRLRVATGESRAIVGVARDIKYARINEEPKPYVYLPFLQSYQSAMILHARGRAGGAALIEQVRGHVRTLDPELPILDAKTLGEQTGAALSIFQMTAAMLLMFGIAATGLATIGLYGLVSYAVKQSTREIGIRMALGAQRADVIGWFLGRGVRLGLSGAALGIVGALAASRLLAALLYGVSTTDIVSFAGASVVVLGSTLVATLIPAWRAARTNPIDALRHF